MTFEIKYLKHTVIILILPLYVFSQNKIYSEEYNIKINYNTNRVITDAIKTFADSALFYYTTPSSEKKKRTFYKYNVLTKEVSILELFESNKYKDIFSRNLYSFALTEKYLVMLFADDIYIFKRTESTFEYLKKLPNHKIYRRVELLDKNTLFLSVNYKFHPMDSPYPHVWAKLDLNTLNIKDETIMGNENAPYGSFVNSWYSVYKGLIAYTHSDEYKINFYDEKFNLIDSIRSDFLKENQKYQSIISSQTLLDKSSISDFYSFDDTALTRIQKIFLLDSTHIMTILKLPKSTQLLIHLWEKNGKWNLKQNQVIPGIYIAGENYNQTNNSVIGFYGNMNGIIIYKRNIYIIYFPYMENPTTTSFDWDKDYNVPMNDLIKEKKLFYGIRKIKLNYD